MAGLVKSKSSQEEEIKQLETANNVDDALSPEEEYNKACLKRKRLAGWGLALLIVIESVIASGFGYEIVNSNLYNRIVREYEIRSSGKIQLTQGFYSGETDFGYFSGEGSFSFDTGAEYIGFWDNNQIKGNGTLNVPTEGVYEGEFLGSKKNGKGVFTWEDGTVYDGEWKYDQMCGQGTYTTSDEIIYVGSFQSNSFLDGTCKFSNSTGFYELTYRNGEIDKASITYADGSTYEGTCEAEGLTGNGTMTFVSGDVYVGAFFSGYRSGQGVYSWTSGNKYDGEWAEDQMNGTGTYTYLDGSYVSGTFEKNVFIDGSYHIENDFGTYTFTISDGEPTDVEMSLANGTTYSGGMKDGKLSGLAQIKYSNGDKYSGTVSDGQKSGHGSYTWTSGASYEGQWSEDQMNGSGTYFYSPKEDGYKLSGTFTKGKPSGVCHYYTGSFTYYITDWSNGRCVKIYE